ncbi:hypothetical protein ACSFA7_12645 [Variovorax sp. LT1R20]
MRRFTGLGTADWLWKMNAPQLTGLAAMQSAQRSTKIFIASAVLAAMATACVSPQEIAAADKRTCAGYGFAEGTDAFANCMMQADQNRQKAAANRERQWQAEEQQRRLADQQRQQHQNETVRPTHEQCVTAGNSVTTGSATSNTTSSFSNTVCSGR